MAAQVPRPANSNGLQPFARRGMAGAGRTFAAATERLEDGTHVVRVMGEVDLATAPALERMLLAVDDDPSGAVIVDLTGCAFLDSTGLRALIATRTRLERSSRPLALVLSNPNVLRILQITGCDKQFDIYPSLGAAVDGDGASARATCEQAG
jgi:anti-sigma B factor antagonist